MQEEPKDTWLSRAYKSTSFSQHFLAAMVMLLVLIVPAYLIDTTLKGNAYALAMCILVFFWIGGIYCYPEFRATWQRHRRHKDLEEK